MGRSSLLLKSGGWCAAGLTLVFGAHRACADTSANSSAAGPLVVEVQTAQQLAAAIAGGGEHILITRHLDLRGLPTEPLRGEEVSYFPGGSATLQSLRVRDPAMHNAAWAQHCQ